MVGRVAEARATEAEVVEERGLVVRAVVVTATEVAVTGTVETVRVMEEVAGVGGSRPRRMRKHDFCSYSRCCHTRPSGKGSQN